MAQRQSLQNQQTRDMLNQGNQNQQDEETRIQIFDPMTGQRIVQRRSTIRHHHANGPGLCDGKFTPIVVFLLYFVWVALWGVATDKTFYNQPREKKQQIAICDKHEENFLSMTFFGATLMFLALKFFAVFGCRCYNEQRAAPRRSNDNSNSRCVYRLEVLKSLIAGPAGCCGFFKRRDTNENCMMPGANCVVKTDTSKALYLYAVSLIYDMMLCFTYGNKMSGRAEVPFDELTAFMNDNGFFLAFMNDNVVISADNTKQFYLIDLGRFCNPTYQPLRDWVKYYSAIWWAGPMIMVMVYYLMMLFLKQGESVLDIVIQDAEVPTIDDAGNENANDSTIRSASSIEQQPVASSDIQSALENDNALEDNSTSQAHDNSQTQGHTRSTNDVGDVPGIDVMFTDGRNSSVIPTGTVVTSITNRQSIPIATAVGGAQE